MIRPTDITKAIIKEGKAHNLVIKRTNRLGKDMLATYRIYNRLQPQVVIDIAVNVNEYQPEFVEPLVAGIENNLRNEPRQ